MSEERSRSSFEPILLKNPLPLPDSLLVCLFHGVCANQPRPAPSATDSQDFLSPCLPSITTCLPNADARRSFAGLKFDRTQKPTGTGSRKPPDRERTLARSASWTAIPHRAASRALMDGGHRPPKFATDPTPFEDDALRTRTGRSYIITSECKAASVLQLVAVSPIGLGEGRCLNFTGGQTETTQSAHWLVRPAAQNFDNSSRRTFRSGLRYGGPARI